MDNHQFDDKRTIWVLGGAGYVGSHIAQAFIDDGQRVGVIDRRPLTKIQKAYGLDAATNVEGNIETTLLQQTIKPSWNESLVIVNAVGPSSVSESWKQSEDYWRDHVHTMMSLIEFLEPLRQERPDVHVSVIHASSCTVYKPEPNISLNENADIAPKSPYALAKWSAESILKLFANKTQTPTIAFRFFNAAGADARGHLYELHEPETHLIPLFLASSMTYADTFRVFGQNHQTTDGTCVRDYVHVTDIANAHLRAVDFLQKQTSETDSFNAINLGTGYGHSVLQVMKAVEKVLDREIEFTYDDARSGDAAYAVASIDKAQDLLDWHPEHSDITNIIRTAIEGRKLLPV